ncbi:MAG TPA: hypothetical protein VFQ88_15320 [Nevskiaceae bacterium]|nr:hypothetical protein [Nevskiaceae bacterium]
MSAKIANPDATPLLGGRGLVPDGIRFDDAWADVYENMVTAAVKRGALPEGTKVSRYLYIQQSNGDLCVFAQIAGVSDKLVGTTIPQGGWWQESTAKTHAR